MAVKVNGHLIPDEAIEREAQHLKGRMRPEEQKQLQGIRPELAELRIREQAKQQMIDRLLVRLEAENRNPALEPVAVEKEFERLMKQRSSKGEKPSSGELDEIRREVETRERIRLLLDSVFEEGESPGEPEALAYYEKHPEQFRTPERVRAAHIVVHGDENEAPTMERAQAQILEAQKALEGGETFTAVAERFSDCPSKGGDLGMFPRGQMVPRFEEVVFGMTPGQVSEPFITEFGWHIARVEEKEEAGVTPFAEVKEQLIAFLSRKSEEKRFKAFLDGLRADSQIEEVRT